MNNTICSNLFNYKFEELFKEKIKLKNKLFQALNNNKLLTHFQKYKAKDRIQLVWDIDDTIKVRSDNSFPFNTLYPGIKTILSITNFNNISIFITSRPKIVGTTVLDKLDIKNKLVLHGDLISGIQYIFNSYQNAIQDKINNLIKVSLLFPEFKFILIGDTGKVDPMFFKSVINYPFVDNYYLHKIRIKGNLIETNSMNCFESYDQLINILFKKGLISKEQYIMFFNNYSSEFIKLSNMYCIT